jgi:ADP-ribosylglycohydrolase
MEPTLSDRVSGCLLAGALGDSIGAQFEGQASAEFILPDRLDVTDDTQLTIATCEAIIAQSFVDPESIGSRLTDWFRDRRISGVGSATLKSLTELDAGGHWAMVAKSSSLKQNCRPRSHVAFVYSFGMFCFWQIVEGGQLRTTVFHCDWAFENGH